MKKYYFIGLVFLFYSCKKAADSAHMVPPEIPVYTVESKDVPIYNEFIGQIYGIQDIPIRTRVDGILEGIHFREGTKVKKGQLLYSIDPDPFAAEVAAQKSVVAEAKTMMVNARNELERYRPLAEINAVSKSDLDAAQANYDARTEAVNAASAKLSQALIKLGYCSIEAPTDGLIGKTEARIGEYVGRSPNPVILNTLSRIDTVLVRFAISENKYLELAQAHIAKQNIEAVTSEVEAGRIQPSIKLLLADGTLYKEKGQVDFVNNQINASTGSLLIQASFPNPSQLLRPGLYARVRVMLSTAEDAILIPQRCLLEIQGQYSVLAINDNNEVVNKSVVPGTKIGDMVILEQGLEDGEQVVIDALQKVRPGQKINPVASSFESKIQFDHGGE